MDTEQVERSSGRSRREGVGPGRGAETWHCDAVLALRLKEHSQEALAEVYRRHGQSVVAFARSRTGNASAAEDIAQDVFLALWRQPGRFDPARGSLRTYLLTLTSGRAIDTFRSEDARRRRQDRFYPEVDAGPDVEDSVVASDNAAIVQRSLATLPADERAAIDLAYFGRHTYREVACLLGKPEGTIKSRIRSGLERLRSMTDLAPAMASQC